MVHAPGTTLTTDNNKSESTLSMSVYNGRKVNLFGGLKRSAGRKKSIAKESTEINMRSDPVLMIKIYNSDSLKIPHKNNSS
jgi:hypothetical protein